MGIHRAPQDSWVKEMAKWESRPVMLGDTYIEPIPFESGGRGGAPRQEYPKALYRGELASGGPKLCDEVRLVHDEGQERIALGQGWVISPVDALESALKRQRDEAELAANREYLDRNMSELARAEARAVDEGTMNHLPAIPETPIKRGRGRPRAANAAGEERR